MEISFSHIIQGQVLVITPQGERLDAKNASAFKKQLLDLIDKTGMSKLVLDLGFVHFIDSSGLGALLLIQRTLKKQGGSLKLAHLNKNILTIFEIVSMNRIFDIFTIAEEAVKSF